MSAIIDAVLGVFTWAFEGIDTMNKTQAVTLENEKAVRQINTSIAETSPNIRIGLNVEKSNDTGIADKMIAPLIIGAIVLLAYKA